MLSRARLLLCLAPVWIAAGCADELVRSRSSDERVHRVAICGHLYSLYVPHKTEDPEELVGWRTPLAALAEELGRLRPEKTFFLGDNTRYSLEAEWDFLEEALAGVPGERVWVAGNHDYRDRSVFEAHGGVANSSFVIGDYKLITLDAKSILEADDLAFLERELADHEDYREVFLLMHFFLPSYDDPEEGSSHDPFEAYTGFSNWNRDVVPLLAGRVRYVFAGDYYPRHLDRSVHVIGEHELHYIQTSFLFGRGKTSTATGDGPMIFLELELGSDGFRILPHAVPLDVRDAWYRNFRVLEQVWLTHWLDAQRFAIELPSDWRIQAAEAGVLTGSSTEAAEWKQKSVEVRLVTASGPVTPQSLAASLQAELEGHGAGPPILSLAGNPIPWFVGPGPDGRGAQITLCLAADGRGYLVRVRGPQAAGGEPATLLDIVGSIQVGGAKLGLP